VATGDLMPIRKPSHAGEVYFNNTVFVIRFISQLQVLHIKTFCSALRWTCPSFQVTRQLPV